MEMQIMARLPIRQPRSPPEKSLAHCRPSCKRFPCKPGCSLGHGLLTVPLLRRHSRSEVLKERSSSQRPRHARWLRPRHASVAAEVGNALGAQELLIEERLSGDFSWFL